jgi:hypothetical protein
VDESGCRFIYQKKLLDTFNLFLDEFDDRRGLFKDIDTEYSFSVGNRFDMLCNFIEKKIKIEDLAAMERRQSTFIGLLFGIRDGTLLSFFEYFKDDVQKNLNVQLLAAAFNHLADDIQNLIDEGQKIKSKLQRQKTALEAAKKVLSNDGVGTEEIADARTAVHAIRDQILNDVYDTEIQNNNQIKVQFAAALMAYDITPKEEGTALFYLLQKMMGTLPLPHFRKLVTVSDLFKEAFALYKELIKPPEAEEGAAAAKRQERHAMLPPVPAAPPAALPAAGAGGLTGDDWGAVGNDFPKPTKEEVEYIRQLHEERRNAASSGKPNFFSDTSNEGWAAAGGGGQPRGRARLPDHSKGGGSNLAPGGAGFFGGGNRFEVLDDRGGQEGLPQRKIFQAKSRRTDAPEPTEEDFEDFEPPGGAAAAAIEEIAAEEIAASEAGSARSGRQSSASAGGAAESARSGRSSAASGGGGSGRASSRSRSRARSESAGRAAEADAAMPNESEAPALPEVRSAPASTRASGEKSATLFFRKYKQEHPEASLDEIRRELAKYLVRMDVHYTPEEVSMLCDKMEQSFKFENLSQRYEDY